MKKKLMLVDDHPLFLEGLQYLLETHGIEVADTASNGREALEKARRLKPHIVLMDVRMPECSGIDALKMIKAEMPEIKIIMLTTSEEDKDLFDAVKFGASGYLLKNTNAQELVGILSDLEQDVGLISPLIATQILEDLRSRSNFGNIHPNRGVKEAEKAELTERQLEVLELVAKGITYKQVGDALGLTERTVKYHMGRIIEQLHFENRAQVIAYAAKIGLVK